MRLATSTKVARASLEKALLVAASPDCTTLRAHAPMVAPPRAAAAWGTDEEKRLGHGAAASSAAHASLGAIFSRGGKRDEVGAAAALAPLLGAHVGVSRRLQRAGRKRGPAAFD